MITFVFGQRSGTSSMVRALQEAGLDVPGPLDDLDTPAHIGGVYENREARDLNCQLLATHKMWHNFPGITPLSPAPKIHEFLEKHPGHIILKDPRFNLTWPTWICSTNRTCRAIWCRRDFGGTVESMVKWYHYDEDRATRICQMFDLGAEAAHNFMPLHEAWLHDKDRESQAIEWARQRKAA